MLRCVSQRCPLIFDNCVQAAYKAVAEGGFGDATMGGGGDTDNSRLVFDVDIDSTVPSSFDPSAAAALLLPLFLIIMRNLHCIFS